MKHHALRLPRTGIAPALWLLALSLMPGRADAQQGISGLLDPDFHPSVTGSYVRGFAFQPDGKLVLSGNFTAVDGQSRNGIARLTVDSAVESTATFNAGSGANFWTTATAVQADGEIIVCGPFSTVNGQNRRRLARLNADGSVESTATFNIGTGVVSQYLNDAVACIALQPDGKILVGGQLSSIDGRPRRGIARLNANGTVEGAATFNAGTGADSGLAGFDATVYAVAPQADGKILIAGDFASVDGQAHTGIARLNANGTVDSTFNVSLGVAAGQSSAAIQALAVQADGKILVAGSFTTVNGQPRDGPARLLTDGTVESTATFHPGPGTAGIRSMALQADGKLVIGGGPPGGGGAFGTGGVARLLADGTAESPAAFNPDLGAEGYLVSRLALQADGKILLGGSFTSVSGQLRMRLARLTNDAATQSLSAPDGTRVQWLRGGSAPEAGQVTFELSSNSGVTWSQLGPGTRIPAGWELTGLSLPASGLLRARGRTSSNGSTGLVESVASFPPPPALSITQADGMVVVAWPFPSIGFSLQHNTGLTSWTTPPETITDTVTTRSLTFSPVPGSRFFRLFKP